MSAHASRTETIGGALARATETLRAAGVDPARTNAELLLAHLLETDRGGLFVRRREPLDRDVAARFVTWVARRAAREPLQHVTGVQEFHGLEFGTDRRALVPRPETEGLVDLALGYELPEGARVADLGTGTGCIAITLAVKRPGLVVDALDRSEDALDLARENARRHGVEARVRFTAGDFARPPAGWRGAMDLVVSNPPYVAEREWESLEPEVRVHDPHVALVPGPSGYEAYRALAPASHELLKPRGRLLFELGEGQADEVRELVTRAGFTELAVTRDLRGIERVLAAVKPPSGGAA